MFITCSVPLSLSCGPCPSPGPSWIVIDYVLVVIIYRCTFYTFASHSRLTNLILNKALMLFVTGLGYLWHSVYLLRIKLQQIHVRYVWTAFPDSESQNSSSFCAYPNRKYSTNISLQRRTANKGKCKTVYKLKLQLIPYSSYFSRISHWKLTRHIYYIIIYVNLRNK